MNRLYRTAYDLGLRMYALGARIAAYFGYEKAKYWLRGQKQWRERLRNLSGQPVIWMHCASLGEYEQGRPVLNALREHCAGHQLVVSFFSPSGHEQFKGKTGDVRTVYLPLDRRKNAAQFVQLLQPDLVFFVKYEFWINVLEELEKHNIPVFLISAVFSEKQFQSPVYGTYLDHCLRLFSHVFVQDKPSIRILGERDIPATRSGDTRIDRVLELPREASHTEFKSIEQWIMGRRVLLCGSTWPGDEGVLFSYLEQRAEDQGLALILVPHDTGESHIRWMVQKCPLRTLRFSERNESMNTSGETILIVDAVGMLSRLYKLADIAYVGGAFGSGLHNILEPAAFRIPIVFGPEYGSFPEARALIDRGSARSIQNADQLAEAIRDFSTPEVREMIRREISSYLQEHSGATTRMIQYLRKEEYL